MNAKFRAFGLKLQIVNYKLPWGRNHIEKFVPWNLDPSKTITQEKRSATLSNVLGHCLKVFSLVNKINYSCHAIQIYLYTFDYLKYSRQARMQIVKPFKHATIATYRCKLMHFKLDSFY